MFWSGCCEIKSVLCSWGLDNLRVASYELRVDSCECELRVDSCELILRVASCELKFASCEL